MTSVPCLYLNCPPRPNLESDPVVGIVISTSTRSGPSNPVGVPTARAFIAGVTERGSLVPTSVRSIVDYETEFGGLQPYAAHMFRAARTYFEEGGSELVVCRAVGPSPTSGTLSFKDRTPTTPLDTLKIDAASPGAWSSGVTVAIEAGRTVSSVTLSAWLDGERVAYIRDKTTVADIVTGLAGNRYITATDIGAISIGVTRLPAEKTATVLTAGDDKRTTLLSAGVVAALNDAGIGYGAGAVAAPGYQAEIVGADLLAHAKANRRIAILAGQVDDVVDDLAITAGDLSLDGEWAGLFAPWLTIPEGSGSAQISPEGYILGVRSRVINAEGFWQAPAGSRATARFVQGAVTPFDAVDIDALADGHVSGITRFGASTMLYGWRSLSTNTEQYALLSARDFLNTLTELIETTLQPYVFETIDGTGQLLARIKGALVGVLQPIQDLGGITAQYDIAGKESNPAYRIVVSVLNDTTISCTVVVRLAGAAETIQVSIIKAAYNATV